MGQKGRKWKLLFRSVPTRPIIENSKKIATKFVKVINTLMDSFQAKIGWKRLRRSEKKKIILSFRPYPTRNKKFQKNSKKIKNIKKILLWLIFNPKYVGEGQDREKMKIIVPIRSYPTHNWKFQKNSNNIWKDRKSVV